MASQKELETIELAAAQLENTVVESEPSWNEPERFGLGSIEVRQQARLGASRGPRAE